MGKKNMQNEHRALHSEYSFYCHSNIFKNAGKKKKTWRTEETTS